MIGKVGLIHNILNLKEHSKWTTVNSTDMAINVVLNGHGIALIVDYLGDAAINKSGPLTIPST
ncbi:hypothetical protein J8L98_17730 [Pseudoalteromonas sp. MMG013]|uniref:hypothetical protein n=1 Tax=Pseudoalteromonas sp. MMG013 TaxID=2822687 RepID=UPI001B35A1F0|nr:hypothetical protein [Pseudoalteromonas sp. MMG013]MBQ4863525.1 hypothetical protein [Pseudoalteromonas sp. MMG013]